MPTYDVPGVYIEEITGPGVITGVGTSTAGFIGPALAGQFNIALRVNSWDEFLSNYGILNPDGVTYGAYIYSPKWYYMAPAIRSFFQNGGQHAYIVRVGTGQSTLWSIVNQNTPTADVVFQLQAKQPGVAGDSITVNLQRSASNKAGGINVATGVANVIRVTDSLNFDVDDASKFRAGDIITKAATPESLLAVDRAQIALISGNHITLLSALSTAPVAGTDQIQIASIMHTQTSFRMGTATPPYLAPGSVVQMNGFDPASLATAVSDYVLIQAIDQAGFVTPAATPSRVHDYSTASGAAAAPSLTPLEFKLTIALSSTTETFDNLSLNPIHPNYVFTVFLTSNLVNILPPAAPPVATGYPASLVPMPIAATAIAIQNHGANDDPGLLTANDYSTGLDVLENVEDVNLVCIPDAAARGDCTTIQNDMINHCLEKRDRFAILDSQQGLPPSGNNSIETQRASVQADSGFAALYYPWLQVPDPTWKPTPSNMIPATMLIPPSGAIAGVYARVDNSPGGGVHKAPANTAVQQVVGLERKLSDRQQGPLNLEGIDVLRIFPGSGQVTVWGARTTGDPNITDWIYVNVRRLMIYIEQSIEVGIRWAVFEPNNLALWQKLKRTITEFLTRVWRDGALFGATADQAFYVRIDEALNPPSTRALGRLYIEIGVAPVRPAEFIIVRIGLWDGGAQVTES